VPSIAVVMATFNGEEWLDTQLQSLANQTRLPDRLVISDDGSTDDTVKISQEFARSAPFEVVLLEGPRAGYGENFWFAGKHAETDIIAWCDQDDFWYPQKLQLCEQLMVGHGVQFLSHLSPHPRGCEKRDVRQISLPPLSAGSGPKLLAAAGPTKWRPGWA
jgi:glycosyltransferase involved in cell wall biosynthesis